MGNKIKYDDDNRITYDEDQDTLYIWKAPCQGQLGSVLLYHDNEDKTMVSLDTDEVGTIVGIEINNLSLIVEKFNLKNN
jgi:uncharacterized protein YuzE|tara:strand:- start:535 stop:771 length:237 start_codon:yes stop_codon:yes gene_type:complete